ncbi:T9SS type A sorting domain-containing protein [Hymenobacter siberiensis]|uniref:T9SS type A sorting domain-containing protein n=1 Tax=Hymenobacter siberiensis TaxID=2848396 RepID=UPI001C1E319C|nr:T9SS type A sorting domain-containing protein [Hymenobacter siberiensis]
MKKSTLKFGFLLAFLFSATVSMAQLASYGTIGVIGTATSPTGAATGWDNSIAMTRTVAGGHDWTITMQFSTNEMKFRADNLWANSWGSTAFPTSTPAAVTYNGANIPVAPAGRYTVRFNDQSGAYSFSIVTATQSASAAILKMAVSPNPASGTASVSYELPATATAAITVQNLMGQSVRQFSAVRQNAGLQSQSLPLQNLASGIYLVKLETGTLTQTTRLVVE